MGSAGWGGGVGWGWGEVGGVDGLGKGGAFEAAALSITRGLQCHSWQTKLMDVALSLKDNY